MLAVAFQGLISKYIPQFKRIDLTLIITVYFSLKRKPLQGTLVGASAGYAYDLATGEVLLGAGSFIKTVIGFVISTINVHFAIDRKLMRLLILVIASIVNVMLFWGLHSIFNMPLNYPPPEIVKLTAWQAAGNLILGFFIFPFLDRAFVEQPYVGSSRRAAHW